MNHTIGPLSLGYITTELPALTTTFIYREIFELRKQGCKVELFSVWKPDTNEISEEARRLMEEIHYIYPVGVLSLVLSQALWLFTSPLMYLRTLALALSCNPEPPGKIVKKLKIIYHFFVSAHLAKKVCLKDIRHFHAHFAHSPTNIAMFTSGLLGITFSFTAHAMDIYEYVFDLETQIREATFVNVISEYNKKYLIGKYGSEIESKLKVVYCGIDCSKYVPRAQSIANTVPRILTIARLVEKKGIEYLIEACNLLKLSGYNFRCQIIGDGVLKDELKKMIGILQLCDVVELIGAVSHDKIPELLTTADLFVLPCIIAVNGDRDGIPVSLMEAMALGVPVISTKLTGIPELIEHNQSGLLVPPKNSKQLAETIAFLIDNPERRKKFSQNARERILKDFNLQKNVSKLKSIFESVLVNS